jgi:hypothetical protein
MSAQLLLRNELEEETTPVEFTGNEFVSDLVEMLFDNIEEIQMTDETATYYGVIYAENDDGTRSYTIVDFEGLETIEEQIDRMTDEAIEAINFADEAGEDDEEEDEYYQIRKLREIC